MTTATLQSVIDGHYTKLINELPPDKFKELDETCQLTPESFADFHQLKTLAYTEGKLSLGMANEIYSLMGNTHLVFNSRPLPTRYALIRTYKILMDAFNQ